MAGSSELYFAHANQLNLPRSGAVWVFERLRPVELPVGGDFVLLSGVLGRLLSIPDNWTAQLRDFPHDAHL